MAATIYFTASDLKLATDEDFLVEVSDDNEEGIPDENVIANAVENACSFVDGYVQIAPGLPIATITGILKDLGMKIAIYNLALRRRVVPADIKEARNFAIQQLEKIRDGEFTIGDASIPTSDIRNALSTNKTEDDKKWSEDYLNTHYPRINH